MELGLNLSMTHWATGPEPNVGLARTAESAGFSTVWVEEAYGSDAVSPLAWVGASTTRIGLGSAVWQMPARTPAMTAMTAATIDVLSGGRLRLGLGSSGPQVVEGWHGQPYEKPLAKTREYIEIVRRIVAREAPVSFDGEHYQLPYRGPRGVQAGKPLKLILHPLRPRIPIYLGALGPKNVELAAEVADGWLPIFMVPRALEAVFGEPLERGFAKAGGKTVGVDFDIAPVVSVVVGDDVDLCRLRVKQRIALYVGGMGSRTMNFSNTLIRRFGYEEAADDIQNRFLAGDREGAVEAVPDELVDEVALCGPPDRIAQLLKPWRESRVSTIVCDTDDPVAIGVMADLVLDPRVDEVPVAAEPGR